MAGKLLYLIAVVPKGEAKAMPCCTNPARKASMTDFFAGKVTACGVNI
jgi:hypothetical protein